MRQSLRAVKSPGLLAADSAESFRVAAITTDLRVCGKTCGVISEPY